MHLIESIDRTYSNKGTEWHGLAIVPTGSAPCQSLTREQIAGCLFPIREAIGLRGMVQTGTGPDGAPIYTEVAFPERKGVVADLTARGEGLIPLEVHTDKYAIAENSRIFAAIEGAMSGTGHRVTTAGTLDGCNRFYASVELENGIQTADGHRAFAVMVTSHDGTLALQTYGSNVRPVCNNTVRASLRDAANKVRLKHTGDMEVKLDGLESFLSDLYKHNHEFAAAYGRLQNSRVTKEDAIAGILGHFWLQTGTPDAISTRTRNAVTSVASRFERGKGNHGETMADVLNGFTEYYSIGEGTGKDATPFERQMLSWFGSQADKKEEFAGMIMDTVSNATPDKDATTWQECVEAGKGPAGQAWKSGLERNRAASNATTGERRSNGYAVQPEAVQPVAAVQTGSDIFASLLDAPLSR